MPFPLRPAALAAAALLAFGTACSEAPEPAARVAEPETRPTLPSGEIVGFAAEYGSHAWLGVPFAEPPVDALRWKAPRPAPPWEGTHEALESGSPCVQLATPLAGITSVPRGTAAGSEDCLYLDLYAPAFAPDAVPTGDARLPVMVWIHGGGNTVGYADFYHGGNLAASEDVIVVAIQYRLGPLGWLRHAALRGEGTTAAGRSGNYGLLDQIRALEWVQEHVEAFGGDPERVTIFGESAGGRNVVMLMLSREARGLFHRAIVQSGGTDTLAPDRAENWTDDPIPGHAYSANEALGKLLVADGTAADREAAKAWVATRDFPEIAEYLRAQDAYDLLDVYRDSADEDGIRVPQMFADGYVLPRQDALGRFGRGAYNQVPVILGTNRDEQRLFLAFDPQYSELHFGVVPDPHDPDLFFSLAEHLSDAWKATGADQPATALHEQQPGRGWVYRFDWDEELSIPWVRLDRTLGASHGFEIPFVFDHWDLGPQSFALFTPFNRSGRKTLSDAMRSYWAEFGYAGDPGQGRTGELPRWTPWDDATGDVHRQMILDTEADGGIRMGSELVTMERVLDAVGVDERLDDARDLCIVYRELAAWRGGFDADDYASLEACAEYDYDAFPWPDEETEAADGSEAPAEAEAAS